MARRTKGDGALYQRADGRWCGAVDLGWNPKTGARRRKVVTAKTQAEALAKLRAVRRAVEEHGDVPTSSTTVHAWLERWLRDIAGPTVKPKTLDGYAHKAAIIDEAIGRIRLDKLTPAHVRQVHQHAAGDGKRTDTDGNPVRRSPTTAVHCHRVLRKALEDARREGLVLTNVADLVSPPRAASSTTQPLTAAQSRRLLQAVQHDPNAARWLIALLYGVRQGEALGLTWACVDYDAGTIDLAWQLQRFTFRHGCAEGSPCRSRRGSSCPRRHLGIPAGYEHRVLEGAWVLTRPKKEKPRIVPMLGVVEAALRQRQDATAHQPSPYDLVFCREDGRPFDPAKDNHAWHAWLDAAGLPSLRLHDARHSAATLLQSLGVEEATRMSILGHSTATVQRGYAHVDLTLQRAALERAAKALTEP